MAEKAAQKKFETLQQEHFNNLVFKGISLLTIVDVNEYQKEQQKLKSKKVAQNAEYRTFVAQQVQRRKDKAIAEKNIVGERKKVADVLKKEEDDRIKEMVDGRKYKLRVNNISTFNKTYSSGFHSLDWLSRTRKKN